jgi:protein SCO1
MTPRRLGVLALIAATAAALAAALVLALDQPASRPGAPSGEGSQTLGGEGATGFAGAAVPALPARDFALADQSRRPVSLASVRGQVTVLAFLSSTCAAACTLIAQQVRGALDELAHPAPVLLISVDPSGDTPANVARFLARVSLAGRARFLTGTRAALEATWHEYGVHPLSSGRSAFERSATVGLLDRHGRERVLFGVEQLTPEGLAHDIRKLS